MRARTTYMIMLNDLFVNLCVLGMLLFILNLFTRNRKGFISAGASNNRKLQFGVCMGLVGSILMHYTIHFNGTIMDLRQIPVVAAAVYGGMMPPVVAAVLIAVCRVLLFGVNKASIIAAVLILLVGISCGMISKLHWNLGKKWTVMTASNLLLTSVAFYILVDDSKVLLNVYIGFWTISILGGIVIYYLSEYLRQSKDLFQMAQEEAVKDFLTGLYNVRKFDELLKECFEKADAHEEAASFILADIDHFKHINDKFGHQCGDEVLKQFSQILTDSCRSIDIVSRNGGEEFSVILPACSQMQALEAAERIRSAVERNGFMLPDGSAVHITVSLGVSTYRETTFFAQCVVKQADDCLYEAKKSGRNKAIHAAFSQETDCSGGLEGRSS